MNSKDSLKTPDSLLQATRYFSDPDVCVEFLASIRWPDGVQCPACEHKGHSYLRSRRLWKCKECGRQFSVKLGTVFEESPIGLDKWFSAVWLIVNSKNGISSHELGRSLKVTQKTAWFMLHRIRLGLQDSSLVKLSCDGGPIEVDETFIGGKARNMHKERRLRTKVREGTWAKTVVMGMLQRDGKVKTQVIPERKRTLMQNIIRENVDRGAQIMTDEHVSYYGLSDEYVHEIINHAEAYVRGNVHTNGIENFWSLLKRGLGGTYVSVEPFHLFRYIDEQAWRFNNRGGKTRDSKITDAQRFEMALSQIVGKRLTYDQLTGKEIPF